MGIGAKNDTSQKKFEFRVIMCAIINHTSNKSHLLAIGLANAMKTIAENGMNKKINMLLLHLRN